MYKKTPPEPKLFLLRDPFDQVPAGHFYRKLDRLLGEMDLGWVEAAFVRVGMYDPHKGRPGIGPKGAFRILLVGFFERTENDAELARRIQDSLALRWFIGLPLDRRPPHSTTIRRIRRLAPPEVVRKAVLQVLDRCIQTGLIPLTHDGK